MRYGIPGLIIGAVLSLFLFMPDAGGEIYPEWWSGISAISSLEISKRIPSGSARFFVRTEKNHYLFKGNGEALVSGSVAEGLAAFSGNGRYYVKYQKVGNDIEFYNARGDRFWKLESMEYPYLSYEGKLIFLLNGDQSGIRMVDYNGNLLGKPISGRTCTVISFSDQGDYGAAGFLDGSYHVVNAKGRVIARGATPSGTLVKGIAVNSSGTYAAVHYGNNVKDYVRIIEIASGDEDSVELKHIHLVKTSLHVNNDGFCTIIDFDRIIRISHSGNIKLTIDIPPKRHGHSSISYKSGIYAVTYTMQNGTSKLILFREEGVILLSKEFPAESFLDSVMRGNLVLLRGSDTIYCYRLLRLF